MATPQVDDSTGFTGTLLPVFCTADIPAETVSLLLTRSLKYSDENSFRLAILSTSIPSAVAAIDSPSTTPAQPFISPFKGKTTSELNAFFTSHVVPLMKFTNHIFLVLDTRSAEDETCCLVNGGKGYDPEDEMSQLRTDFYLPAELGAQAELGVTELGENMDRDQVWGIHNIQV